jgi:hypothetical protein
MTINGWWERLKGMWQPSPVRPPTVDPAFRDMDGLGRCAEAWRYFILSLEQWLSPNGALREWIRQVVRLSLPLAAPALLVIPLITFILTSFLRWTILMASIAWKAILLMVVVLVGFVITAFNWLLLKTVLSSRNIR